MSRLIVPVVGMHRSGTSSIAGALHRGGIVMGDECNFIPSPNSENPKGFFENFRFRKINDSLIERSNYKVKSWNTDLPYFNDNLILRIKRFWLLKYYSWRNDVWGWKDPRTCLTLKFWLRSLEGLGFGNYTRIIYIYRNPVSVAKSLKKRNGLELEQGLKLWFKYNKRALEELNESDVGSYFVAFESLLNYPELVLAGVKGFLDGKLDLESSVEFIDPDLDRSSKRKTRLDGISVDMEEERISRLYKQLKTYSKESI